MTGTQPACSTSLRAAWPRRAPRSTTQNEDSCMATTVVLKRFHRQVKLCGLKKKQQHRIILKTRIYKALIMLMDYWKMHMAYPYCMKIQ